ncbi:MAG: glycine betaine ABC transporter substrate-binding protein [Rubrobacteraceae bacterium]
MKTTTKWMLPAMLALFLAVAFAAACGNVGSSGSGGEGPAITVGSKNFTEQLVLGEMYSLTLEEEGFNVEERLDLGSIQIADRALQNGQIDVYPEYTGSALVAIFGVEPEDYPEDPEATLEEVRDLYSERDPSGTMLAQTNFENTYGIVVRREIAEEFDIETLEDLAEVSNELTFATFSEFQERADGFPNMEENYPNLDFGDILIVNDIGLKYGGLENGEADAAIGFTTDLQFDQEEFVIAEDTKDIWPSYYPAPVIRQDYLDENPEVEEVLNSVSEATPDAAGMRDLIRRVDENQEDPEDVAREYLAGEGAIESGE